MWRTCPNILLEFPDLWRGAGDERSAWINDGFTTVGAKCHPALDFDTASEKKKASLNKSWLSHCDWSNTSLPAEVQPAVKSSYRAFPILKVKNVFKGKVKKASSIRKTSHLWAHFSLSGLLQPQPAACWQTCPHPRWGVYPRGFYEAQTKGTPTALTEVKRKN